MEQEVWQRVQASRETVPRNDLRQLQREAMELAAIYRGLSAQLSGNAREQVMGLYRGEKANASALAGVRRLSGQGAETLKLWRPGREELGKTLEHCYHRSSRCMTEYLARSAQGEFGVVFEKMAGREKEHCILIAQLLGGMA